VARLAHATSSTRPTTAMRAVAAGRMMPSSRGLTAISVSGATTSDAPDHTEGYRCCISDVKRPATARAWAIDTPGASRAFRNIEWLPRAVSSLVPSAWIALTIWMEPKKQGARPATEPVYDFGATPTIV